MAHTFKLACVVFLAWFVVMSHQNGTTLHLEKIFKGRCLNYIITRSDLLASAPGVNCDNLWIQFSSAWIHKDPSGSQGITYDQLFRHLAQKLPVDKSLFWSNTKALAQKLSNHGRHYVTLEDTLIGSVADGLTWCGQTSGDGINYTNCPPYMLNAAVTNFWRGASIWFASQAVGKAKVLLNGSDPDRKAYRPDSIFRSVEVPALRSGVVKKLTAFVVHDLGKAEIEDCTSQSLRTLRSDVGEKNISFYCCIYPKDVKMNGNSSYNPQCELNAAVILGHFKHGSSIWAQLTSATTMATLLMISFMYV